MTRVRYNPGIYGNETLIKEFIVRKDELNQIVEILHESSGGPSKHIIIVGPRGIGKTTLVRRVAAEIRTDKLLCENWYPIVFAEEPYEVGTPGEFWLTSLFHLWDQTQNSRLRSSYDDIKRERDETRLRERALSELMDFADREKRRILLIVENLNMLLGQQLTGHDGWVLRHTLQNEPRVMLLGTAPARFQDIEHVNKAWFEIVTIYELQPLQDRESRILWETLTSKQLTTKRLRPIQILTGGNPRLLSILAAFSVQTSFRELMDDLIQLIDDHTEYFKGQLDGLPALERKVFVALLDRWDPSTAKEVASSARIGVSKASSILGRLSSRGIVTVDKSGSRNMYKASERLYNIYYLMRRRGQPSDRVHAVVAFMVQFYEGEQIITTVKSLAEEACLLDPDRRRDHFYAYEHILRRVPAPHRMKILGITPPEFFAAPDAPKIIRDLAPGSDSAELTSWIMLGDEVVQPGGNLGAFAEAEKATGNRHIAWTGLGTAYSKIQMFAEAERCFLKATELQPEYARSWQALGYLYLSEERYEDAERSWQKVLDLTPESTAAMLAVGQILHKFLDRPGDAEPFLRKATAMEPTSFHAWYALSECLHALKQYEEASRGLQEAVRITPESDSAWAQLGHILGDHLRRHEQAEAAYRQALSLNPDLDWVWARLGQILKNSGDRYQEAEKALRRSLSLRPNDPWTLAELGELLANRLKQIDEGERILQKAVELDTKDTWAWIALAKVRASAHRDDEAELTLRRASEMNGQSEDIWGELGHLLFHFDRFAEAENAFQKVVEINPSADWAWGHLADIAAELGKYSEAEAIFRKALAMDHPKGWIWTSLGDLYLKLGRNEEAEQAYKEGAKESPSFRRTTSQLIVFLLKLGKDDEAIEYAHRFLNQTGSDYSSLNNLATLFHEHPTEKGLQEAELWTRSAIKKAPADEQWRASHTLASILAASGRWDEALRVASIVFDEAAVDVTAVKLASDFVIQAASKGYAQSALQILLISKGQYALEPLILGVKLFLGETEHKAQEILEIGEDVVRRIRELQSGAGPTVDEQIH